MERYVVEKRLGISNEEDFIKKVLSLLRRNRGVIELDMSECEYVSSAGIRGLLIGVRAAKNFAGPETIQKAGIYLFNVREEVYQILLRAGLLQTFHVGERQDV